MMINCVTINFWALLVLMMIVTKVSRLILSFSPVECRKTDIIAPVVCHTLENLVTIFSIKSSRNTNTVSSIPGDIDWFGIDIRYF